MKTTRSTDSSRTGVVVFTADPEFEQLAYSTFMSSAQIDLQVVAGAFADTGDGFVPDGITVVIIDLDAGSEQQMQALHGLMGRIGTRPPVVVVTQSFDADVARRLVRMRVADFLVKPVQPVELVRTCARVSRPAGGAETKEAQIYTFLPAVGGAGVTTIAIQTAMLLMASGGRGRTSS